MLRKVCEIQRYDEIGPAVFGAETEGVVPWIRRYLSAGLDLDFLGTLSNQVDNLPDQAGTNVKAPQNFLVLSQSFAGQEPHEIVRLSPTVKQVCT